MEKENVTRFIFTLLFVWIFNEITKVRMVVAIHSFSDQQIPNYASKRVYGNVADDFRWRAGFFPRWAIIGLDEVKTLSGARVNTYQYGFRGNFQKRVSNTRNIYEYHF